MRKIIDPLGQFLKTEAAGGVALMAAAALSFIFVNSQGLFSSPLLADFHAGMAGLPVTVDFAGRPVLRMTLELWVNDGLMAIFFFVVGLEIKREVLVGHLDTARKAALPALAAVGGAIVPAVIYFVFNRRAPQTLHGWAIPMATDIAFAVGVLSLFGRRVPAALKIFLLALAIVDDLLAILVIAAFYTAKMNVAALGAAAAAFLAIHAMKASGVRRPWAYVLAATAAWGCVLASGIHATIAGVILGLMTPISLPEGGPSPVDRLIAVLHPWVTFLIIPVFAFLNAGVKLGVSQLASSASSPVALGVAAGLVLGKPIGIFLTTVGARGLRLVSLPEGIGRGQLLAVAFLGGIGFTMSLFIGGLSFSDPGHLADAKAGIAAASLTAALLGSALLHRFLKETPR